MEKLILKIASKNGRTINEQSRSFLNLGIVISLFTFIYFKDLNLTITLTEGLKKKSLLPSDWLYINKRSIGFIFPIIIIGVEVISMLIHQSIKCNRLDKQVVRYFFKVLPILIVIGLYGLKFWLKINVSGWEFFKYVLLYIGMCGVVLYLHETFLHSLEQTIHKWHIIKGRILSFTLTINITLCSINSWKIRLSNNIYTHFALNTNKVVTEVIEFLVPGLGWNRSLNYRFHGSTPNWNLSWIILLSSVYQI